MKRELNSGFVAMRRRQFHVLPGKVIDYIIRRTPRLRDFILSQKNSAKIDMMLGYHAARKATFEKISIVYILDSPHPELLSRSIFSLKKNISNPHVLFIHLGEVENEIKSIITNYLPKAESFTLEKDANLSQILSFCSTVQDLMEQVLFINEFPKFNEMAHLLDKIRLDNGTLACVDFIYPRRELKAFYIGDEKKINFYQNLNLFRSFFPIIPRSNLENLDLPKFFSSEFKVLRGCLTLKQLNKDFDDHNIWKKTFEQIFPVAKPQGNEKINNYFFPFNKKVSIIIPTRDKIDLLEKCLKSIERSTYRNYEIIIVDHRSHPISQEYFKNLPYKVIRYEGDYNFSYINNMAVEHSTGDILCFLNNDTEVISTNWLEVLGGFAAQSDVGCVGPKLLFQNNLVQHAGIRIHKDFYAISHIATYEKDNTISKELNLISCPDALTGACLFIEKKKFIDAGKFHEGYIVPWQDVDLCLTLEEHGYSNLFIPYVKLYHYESSTRKAHPSFNEKKDLELFRSRWAHKKVIQKKKRRLNLGKLKIK